MSYFSNNYAKLAFPIGTEAGAGFRPAQIAALHAVGAHFFSHATPAIVVMPTGSGKSAVLTAIPLLLRSARVLVLTPSRLVREQLGENFKWLSDLKKLDAVPMSMPTPAVHIVDGEVTSIQQWESMRAWDVVIATVASLVPNQSSIIVPPTNLFDLILVDEAHHAPAQTWSSLLGSFTESRKVLFTATPFRRDEQSIDGTIVFRYDLKRARDDGIFGDIKFEAVHPINGEEIDITIANAVATRFRKDREGGHQHLVMVRADTVTRAREIHALYLEKTPLRLRFVMGQHSLKHVQRILQALRDGSADGIVCVNMFGEGFNLPELKIAGIHSPHKSLAITLQFIGRFARKGSNVGEATFIAEPHESSAELGALYETGSTWRDIVANLSDSRIDEEVTARQIIDTFEVGTRLPDLEDFSLYTLHPYCHAKVFRVRDVDVRKTPDFPPKMAIVFSGISESHRTAIYISREIAYPKWSADERFSDVAYDVFIFYYDKKHELLFVCASRRLESLYARLLTPLTGGGHTALSGNAINRVLRDLKDVAVFSLGFRSRNQRGNTESYQQRTGGNVDRTVQHADARRFDRGHVFATGRDAGRPVTIGVSSSSKLWSNAYLPIPRLLRLFGEYAKKIVNLSPAITNTGLDLLSAGEELDKVPDGIIIAAWADETYVDMPRVSYPDSDGVVHTEHLLDFDFRILESVPGHCVFSVENERFAWKGRFEIGECPLFRADEPQEPQLLVDQSHGAVLLSEYLVDTLPSFYLNDLSRVEGISKFPERQGLDPFDLQRLEAIDWHADGVDPSKEKVADGGSKSLFDWVVARATVAGDKLIYCDDGAGEIADFVTCNLDHTNPSVRFYHCKASDKPPGARQDDFFEVLGQAMRTCAWFDLDKLVYQIRRRLRLASSTSLKGLKLGGDHEVSWMKSQGLRARANFEVYVVQPGLDASNPSSALLELFAGVANHLHTGGAANFRVICSSTQSPSKQQIG